MISGFLLSSKIKSSVVGLGNGVMDVAGGKGELAFQLLNLSGIPATVIDPRPLDIARYKKRYIYIYNYISLCTIANAPLVLSLHTAHYWKASARYLS